MNEENKENNMSENMIENTGKKQTESIQSEKEHINNNKPNEEEKEKKTLDNLIENSEKKPTESIQTGILCYFSSRNI